MGMLKTVASLALLMFCGSTAAFAQDQKSIIIEYLIRPLSDEALAQIYGGARGGVGRVRTLTETYAVSFSQIADAGSRVSLDTWWSQSGAALIDNNLLAMR